MKAGLSGCCDYAELAPCNLPRYLHPIEIIYPLFSYLRLCNCIYYFNNGLKCIKSVDRCILSALDIRLYVFSSPMID